MPTESSRPILRPVARLAVPVVAAMLVAACGGTDLPSRPDAHRPPKTTTTTTTTSTTTTTTTTLPPVPVPGPVKLGAKCTVVNGRSTDANGVVLYCSPRKAADAKPFAGGVMRWEP